MLPLHKSGKKLQSSEKKTKKREIILKDVINLQSSINSVF